MDGFGSDTLLCPPVGSCRTVTLLSAQGQRLHSRICHLWTVVCSPDCLSLQAHMKVSVEGIHMKRPLENPLFSWFQALCLYAGTIFWVEVASFANGWERSVLGLKIMRVLQLPQVTSHHEFIQCWNWLLLLLTETREKEENAKKASAFKWTKECTFLTLLKLNTCYRRAREKLKRD